MSANITSPATYSNRPLRAIAGATLALLIATSPVLATTGELVMQYRDIKTGADGSGAMDNSNTVVDQAGNAYFRANDGVHGSELWKSDGTATGTVLIKDIRLGIDSSSPRYLTVIGETIFFVANDNDHGAELWKTDGTAAGTVLVKDIYPGADGSGPYRLSNVNGTLFFVATGDAVTDRELWKSDGTEAGTVLVKDINSAESYGSDPEWLTAVGSTLFFTANDGVSGRELWKSDGTEAGTTMVKDIVSGPDSGGAWRLTAAGSVVYFPADDGVHGEELWKSDGTEAGTTLVKDINTGVASGSPSWLTWDGSTLLFQAEEAEHGGELWKSDGTESGTVLLKDIRDGADGSGPGDFFVTDHIPTLVYFGANDGNSGRELWATDGTAVGTVQVADTVTGSNGVNPFNIVQANGEVWFFGENAAGKHPIFRSALGSSAVTEVPLLGDNDQISCDCYSTAMVAGGARIFFAVSTELYGNELGVIFTDGLPSTDRDASPWAAALAIAAALTAAVGVGLRRTRGTMGR